MRRVALAVFAVGLLGTFAAGRASAQYYPPSYGPVYGSGFGTYGPTGSTLSPWLNLTRGGNPAANYFLGVLPEFDRRRNQAEVARQLIDLDRRVETPPAQPLPTDEVLGNLTGGGLPPTGHPAAFANYGSFYNLTPTAAPASRGPQTGQSRGR